VNNDVRLNFAFKAVIFSGIIEEGNILRLDGQYLVPDALPISANITNEPSRRHSKRALRN
jgi:hypothetical protein